MNITELQKEHKEAEKTTNFSKHHAFIEKLLSLDKPEIVEYHFSLLKKRKNRKLFMRLRAAFKKRRLETVKDFLIEKAEKETASELQADALLILGHLRCVDALPIAHSFSVSENLVHRKVASIFLGWVGTKDDLVILGELLLNDPDSEIRSTAATAHTQMYIRRPDTKKRLLANLSEALKKEQDEAVQGLIIITIQYILNKKFGMRENIAAAEISGDVSRAKAKALKALERPGP